MDKNPKFPPHLFASTDYIADGDLRMRIPNQSTGGETLYDLFGDDFWRDIDVLQQRGLVVVDGNHLFLHSLRIAHENLSMWESRAAGGGDRFVPSDSGCPFRPVSARLVSHIAAQLIHRTLDIATQRAALSIIPDGSRVISMNLLPTLSEGDIEKHYDRTDIVVLDDDWRIVTFDAPLPDINQLISDLHLHRSNMRVDDTYLVSFLDLLHQDKFRYWDGRKTYLEDYVLKNAYMEDLRSSYFADSVFGVKKHQWKPGKHPYLYEKQVDVLLTMELCDAALDASLDWVCVITNDSDYVPALSRVRDSGKKTIWLCADEPRLRSKDLLNLFSSDSISVGDLFTRRPLFETLFGWPALFARSGNLPSGERYSTAPWNKSLYEHETEDDAALSARFNNDDERHE